MLDVCPPGAGAPNGFAVPSRDKLATISYHLPGGMVVVSAPRSTALGREARFLYPPLRKGDGRSILSEFISEDQDSPQIVFTQNREQGQSLIAEIAQ
jgi:hypothetical protein